MCSLNNCIFDGNDDDIARNRKKDLPSDRTLCRKCRCENADILLLGQSGYCKTCFLNVTNHKFRAALGKSKIIRHGEKILIDHSGELNSTVLLHLIKAGMSESAHKRLIFETIILYVDDNMQKTNERSILQHKIAEETKVSGFNSYAISISQVLNEEDTWNIKPIDQEINYENDNRLHAILTDLSDNTSRTDFLNQLRRKLLLSAARKLNCNKIFVADSATNIATKVLSDVCLGRGAQLSTQANFCDARTDIKILKPMRDFTQQETEYHKIKPVKSIEDSIPATSIQALACNFTIELESQFSGTISTVFRTADKISPRSNVQESIEDNCALCDARLNFIPSGNEVTAMRAIEVSKLMSSKCIDTISSSNNEENGESNYLFTYSDNNGCCNDNANCNCENRERQITTEDVWRHLCYSCRQIFRNSDILHNLPLPLLLAVQQRAALKKMREKISDFLL
ncbi:Cytoplasmic tRNA 2-thiolation protein 2 [Trachymyrmex zeteki]|uniref:Cytoplasmic tRNA 2-thiolation protein 2 n=1 Tax=Mycetomoellerius zeteki TaxID=64791 RepID=A0A151WJD9_9HYME|nr:PREDICTED: cytoplasmic tRNA 2-thiolation protein 2 [Trachymyrmex zeteki]KYQ47920.1 Cytoplasmic tRNA 2-thiolation protein 2 [Trachymyrmex zeteki]